MYAVIETGGKQYRVELGSEFAVERLDGAPGDTIDLERVLLVADGNEASIGTPLVSDALVRASVVRHDRADKVIVFKYRPKARHRAKKGHRQEQTVIRVADIRFNGRSAADEASAQEKEDAQARKQDEAEAARKAAADKALAAKLEKESAEQAAEAESAGVKKTRRTSKAVDEGAARPADAKPTAKTTSRAKPATGSAAKPAAKTPTKKTTETTKPARSRQARPKKEE